MGKYEGDAGEFHSSVNEEARDPNVSVLADSMNNTN